MTTRPAKTTRPPTPAPQKRTTPATRARQLERKVVKHKVEATHTFQAMALNDVLAQHAEHNDVDVIDNLQAMVAGASPDDAKSLRQLLFKPPTGAVVNGVDADADAELNADWRTGHYPYKHLLSSKHYEQQKYRLQVELLKMQAWVKETGARVVLVFEGRDAAGKGGTIKRFMEHLNPRGARVVALEKPSEVERGQWYFQRYIQHLPTRGEIVMFDRSWYNRAGVEKVMGFCSAAEADAFLQQAPAFEKLLVDDGILLYKYWLTVDQAKQEERFAERLEDPLKRWKLSPIDLKAREKYADYTAARHTMLKVTHTHHAPWTLVDFNDQRRGRLALIRHLLSHLPDTTVPPEPLALPPLADAPLKERFSKGFKPI